MIKCPMLSLSNIRIEFWKRKVVQNLPFCTTFHTKTLLIVGGRQVLVNRRKRKEEEMRSRKKNLEKKKRFRNDLQNSKRVLSLWFLWVRVCENTNLHSQDRSWLLSDPQRLVSWNSLEVQLQTNKRWSSWERHRPLFLLYLWPSIKQNICAHPAVESRWREGLTVCSGVYEKERWMKSCFHIQSVFMDS